MKVWGRDEMAELVSTSKYQAYLKYHRERESRPRIACSDCQFEYVKEDGHDCGQEETEEIQAK